MPVSTETTAPTSQSAREGPGREQLGRRMEHLTWWRSDVAATPPKLYSYGFEAERSLLDFAQVLQLQHVDVPADTASAIAGTEMSTDTQFHPDSLVGAAPAAVFAEITALLREPTTRVIAPNLDTNVTVTDRWDGVVVNADEEFFEGEFVPVGKREPRFHATFLMSEVEKDDLELVRPGALFYVIASRVRVSERRWQPSSVVQFRRIPRPTSEELVEAKAYAVRLRQKLGINN